MATSATPVGFAHPPIRPKCPGLLVKSHSFKVKFALFITESLTTTKPKNIFSSVFVSKGLLNLHSTGCHKIYCKKSKSELRK